MPDDGNVRIRVAVPEDAASLLTIYAPYVRETAVTFAYEVPTEAAFSQQIRSTLTRYPYLVAERGGVVLGYTYAGAFQARAAYGWCAEASIYLSQVERGQGLGRLLYTELQRLLRLQGILGLYACIACPCGDDPYLTTDSIRFHSRMGFQEAGRFHQCGYKFSRWYDMVWMEKSLGTRDGAVSPILPFPFLASDSLEH